MGIDGEVRNESLTPAVVGANAELGAVCAKVAVVIQPRLFEPKFVQPAGRTGADTVSKRCVNVTVGTPSRNVKLTVPKLDKPL